MYINKVLVTVNSLSAKLGADGSTKLSAHCTESRKSTDAQGNTTYTTQNMFSAQIKQDLIPTLAQMPAFANIIGQLNPNDPNFSKYKFTSGNGAKKPLLSCTFSLSGIGTPIVDQNGNAVLDQNGKPKYREGGFFTMLTAEPYQANANNQGNQGGFGAPAPAPAPATPQGGFGGGFGAPAPAPAPTAPQSGFGGFGAPAPAPAAPQGGFGGSFGAPAPAPAPMNPPVDAGFGAAPNPMFGDAAPAPTVPAAAPAAGFGSAPAPAPAPAAPASAPVAPGNPFAAFTAAAVDIQQ